MKIKILFVFLVVLAYSSGLKAQNNFIPQPESVVMKQGNFTFTNTTKIFLPKKFQKDLKPYLLAKLEEDTGLILKTESKHPRINSNYIQFQITKEASVKSEGYILDISDVKIIIKAKDYAGFFNGFQTLRQAIPLGKTESIEIPNLFIKDNPRFNWRGVMLDVSRHFQPKEFISGFFFKIVSFNINFSRKRYFSKSSRIIFLVIFCF